MTARLPRPGPETAMVEAPDVGIRLWACDVRTALLTALPLSEKYHDATFIVSYEHAKGVRVAATLLGGKIQQTS